MIDWPLVVGLLRKHHSPLERVARDISIAPSTLRRLARGETLEPKFSTGMDLLDLALDVLPPQAWQRINLGGD